MRPTLAVLTLGLLLPVPHGDAADARFSVKQRTATTVYLAGGSADGLAVGDRLQVLSGKTVTAEMEVVFLAEHSASCKVLTETKAVSAGDIALLRRGATSAPEAAPPPEPTIAPPVAAPPSVTAPYARRPQPWARVRGSLSLGLSKLWDDTGRGFDFEQRTGRLDLSVWDVAAAPIELNVRTRSRQDLRPRTASFENLPEDERRDRLYELSLRYRERKDRLTVEAGRVGVPQIGVGTLDGVLADARLHKSVRLGGFFGARADVEQVPGFTAGQKYGGYLRWMAPAALWGGGFDALAFGSRETAGSEVSREYVGAQGRYSGRRFHTFQWVEVDLLRGWRKEPEGKSYQLSNLSLSASYNVKSSTSFDVSYDNRRNYRTAETRSVEAALFDTFVHQGLHAGVSVLRPTGIGGSAFVGVRLQDQVSDTAYSYGGALRHGSLGSTHLSAGIDGSGFTNGTTSGFQGAVRLGRNAPSVTSEASWGVSRYQFVAGTVPARLNQWLRFSAWASFLRRFWLSGDAQYDFGDDRKGPSGRIELGYRF